MNPLWKMKRNTVSPPSNRRGPRRRMAVVLVGVARWVVKRLIMLGVMFAALYYVAYQNHLDYERVKDFDTMYHDSITPILETPQPNRGRDL